LILLFHCFFSCDFDFFVRFPLFRDDLEQENSSEAEEKQRERLRQFR
jgi:hypothetical protein